jgi:hypothetical protein
MNSAKLTHKKFMMIKTETTQNTPATLSASTDGLLVEDITLKPVPELLVRDPKRNTLDPLDHVMGKKYVELTFKTEMKNGGTAGSVYAPMDAALQGCGFTRAVHTGVESIAAAVAGVNYGVTPHPVVVIGTPAFSAKSGTLKLTLLSRTITSPEGATFEGIFYPGDGSAALVGQATISDTAFSGVAFDGDLTSLDLTVDDPDAGGVGDPVSTWQVGDSWTFAYVSASEVDVTYVPTSAPASASYFGPGKSVTIEAYFDGLKHVISGALGTMKATLGAGKIGYFEFTFKGLYADPTDASAPSITYIPQKPVILENAAFTIQGFSAVIANFEYTLAADVTLREDAASASSVGGFIITKRNPVGSCDPEADTVAHHAFWNKVMSGVAGAVSLQHGAVSGNIILMEFPKTQYNDAPYEDRAGIMIFKTPLQFNGDAGDDHVKFTFK